MSSISASLWVVATPLGNLGDLTPRAAEILQKVHCIFAEDTRRAGLLCSRLGLRAAKFISLYEQNESARICQALGFLEQGFDIALISDAGTPLLSDPGYLLVKACREAGFFVRPVPGPCAAIAALMASGLPPYPFYFAGFLPRKDGSLHSFFSSFSSLSATLVFYERKNRLSNILQIAYAELGEREFCIARELTKEFEEFIFGTLGKQSSEVDDLLGEITVLIAPPKKEFRSEFAEVHSVLEKLLQSGKPFKKVSVEAKELLSGWTAKELYAECCKLRQDKKI